MIGQHVGYRPRSRSSWAGRVPTPTFSTQADPEATFGFYSSPQLGAPQAASSMVSLRGVSKVFPNGNLVLRDVNLEVRPGEFVFVTGVSGAGKSTLLRLLYGAEQATQGTVTVDQVCLFSTEGRRPYRIPPRPLAMLRRRLGVVFQDYRLLANRTLGENVAFVLRAQGLSPAEIRRRIGPTLKMVGLTEKRDRFPHELSGGEQQRLSLARAIVNMPVLLLADEPTGNLDPENSLLVLQILERLNSFGVTIMMTSHDPYLVERAGHRVVRVEGGHLYDMR
ncbi:MAG: ATP-binding cassette domain-containing protein [Thermostichus sp. HHBFW_bins_43]